MELETFNKGNIKFIPFCVTETEDFHCQNSHQRGMKRSRPGFSSTETVEPEIKRSTFKLQPAILIHGQTKSQTKGTEQSILGKVVKNYETGDFFTKISLLCVQCK